jgi:PhnB protein
MSQAMTQLDPYLMFDGNCAEAMRFYEKTLGGKLEAMHTFGQSPGGDQVPAEHANRIMHAMLVLENRVLMASDHGPGQPYEGPRGFSLSLQCADVDSARRTFEALADGGTVTMPFQETFWAKGFGMLVDRFGTPWMVNVWNG